MTHVFVTHHHIDHTRNIGMFPTARVVDVDSVYDGSLWLEHGGDGYHLSDDVWSSRRRGTPQECAALVVRDRQGTVVLTHAWWFADMTPGRGPARLGPGRPGPQPRAHCSRLADVVVPGHGPAFRPAGNIRARGENG